MTDRQSRVEALNASLDEMVRAAELVSTIGLELRARGLDNDEPIPTAVFIDSIDRMAALMTGYVKAAHHFAMLHEDRLNQGDVNFRDTVRRITDMEERLRGLEQEPEDRTAGS